MEKVKLELQDEKGLTGVFIELPLEKIREQLGGSSSTVADAAEAEAQLKESQGKVSELEERLAKFGAGDPSKIAELKEQLAKATGRTMDDFSRSEKADFVISWAKELSPENKVIFAGAVGIPIAVAAVAEEKEPVYIQGKTDKPGYKYLEHLNLSVKE